MTRTAVRRRALRGLLICACLGVVSESAQAQRAADNAVEEASDAFGTAVGREQIGLYASGNARGFNPSQAGNLRINGLYFDQITGLGDRIVRGSTVHVGISAQGFPFPAPTGVVDFELRSPGDDVGGSLVTGTRNDGLIYAELDVHTPVVADVLSIGGGVGHNHNPSGSYANSSASWSAGAIARWTPNDRLTITPYWSLNRLREHDGRPLIFMGNAGVPRYRRNDPFSQPWIEWGANSDNYGATAVFALGDGWTASTGVFRSTQNYLGNVEAYLLNLESSLDGDYYIESAPATGSGSTSGEARVSKSFSTENVRSTVYASLKGRERHNLFGGSVRRQIGRVNLQAIPEIADPMLTVGATSRAVVRNLTPGIAYEGVWRNVGQLSLGLQKPNYRRSMFPAGGATISGRASPWVYNIGGAAYLSSALAAYASYSKGFEEVGNAPPGAVNRGEAVPAELTTQIDAGLRYQLTPRLQVVGGVFQIEKPYFFLDAANFYRRVGTVRNRGAEFSFAGAVTNRLTVVAGAIYIDPHVDAGNGVQYQAAGPVPFLVSTNLQYRLPWLEKLRVDVKVESRSKRYANASNTVQLPALISVDGGLRYTDRFFDKPVTVRLQGFNLTNVYALRVQGGAGEIHAYDVRRFELSLAVDF